MANTVFVRPTFSNSEKWQIVLNESKRELI